MESRTCLSAPEIIGFTQKKKAPGSHPVLPKSHVLRPKP